VSAPGQRQRLSLGDLAAAGKLILNTYVSQLEAQGVTVPGRRSVTPGNGAQGVAWDGEELDVAFVTIHQGQPGIAFAGTQNPAAAVLFAQWAVLLLRKVPILTGNSTGELSVPSAAKLDQAGQANLTDIGQVTRAALAIHKAYTFNPPGVGMAIDEVTAMGPQGGLVGVRLLFSTSLT
jgi:hypothetical protein